jgi:hypothetical protein
MNANELQKRIAKLKPDHLRSVENFVDRMLTQPPTTAAFDAHAMRNLLGCARNVQSDKSSRRLLTELRGYSRTRI